MKRYKKAPQYMGKILSLAVGGGNRRIADNDILEGESWQKFVAHGFLVLIEDEPPKKVESKPEPKLKLKLKTDLKAKEEPEPLKKEEKKEDLGSMTRSTADKMADAQPKKPRTKKKRK